MLRALLVALFLSVGVSGTACAEEEPAPKLLRVHWLGTEAEEEVAQLRDAWWMRTVLDASPGWKVELVAGWTSEPEPEPSVVTTVVAGLLPLPETVRPLLTGLPVDLGSEKTPRLALVGSEYPQAVAIFRLSSAADADWLVTGSEESPLGFTVFQLLTAILRPERFRVPFEEGFDFVVSAGELQRQGRWREVRTEAGVRYEVDPDHDRDDFAERRSWYEELARIPRRRVELRVPAGEEGHNRWISLANALDRAVATMAGRVPLDPVELAKDRLTVVVEAASGESYVRLGRYTGELKPAVVPEHGLADVHAVLHPDDRYAIFHGVARALVRRGTAPKSTALPPWLERGAGLWLSGDWYGKHFQDWLPRLAAAEVLPTAEELSTPDLGGAIAETLFTPVAAAVASRLPGKTVAEKLGGEISTAVLETALVAVDKAAREAAIPAPARPASHVTDTSLVDTFLAGVSFAMAPGLTTGYHAPRSVEQLHRVRKRLGADAVSLMPMASQRDATQPSMGYLNQGTGTETDLGMLAGARAARERGFTVLWKPHVYIGRGWSGEISMASEEDWSTWWRLFRRYIVHHAFLAAHGEADLFSVGVELGKTLEREAEWRHLIRSVRQFFDGPLTYSGNWWGDADKVPFWDTLDYLGIDAYYPLGESETMSDLQLAAGAKKVVRQLESLADRHGKPILLTEVGFAARKGAWVAPHEEGGEADETDQTRAYRALLTALGRPPWLAGVFVWKVFSVGSDGPPPPRPDFRFLGRPAEEVVRSYFTEREEPRSSTR